MRLAHVNIKRYWIIVTALCFIMFNLQAQKPAYKLYSGEGKKSSYKKMLAAAAGSDVILFGEHHTNPISHWLQLELSTDLYGEVGDRLVMGSEMFEADNQLLLDEYFAGLITETKFEEEARLWKNYQTDYKPLVLLAKVEGLDFIATNIPRRYANSVFKQGLPVLDKLSLEAKSYMAPLPLEYDTALNCYRELMGGMDGVKETPMAAKKPAMPGEKMPATPGDTKPAMPGGTDGVHTAGKKMPPVTGGMGKGISTKLADAQAIKDATMSHFILENWSPGKVFIHYNGAYHSDNYESMNWFLERDSPGLKIVTISTVSQDEVNELEEESLGKADFIICVPSTMTKTSR